MRTAIDVIRRTQHDPLFDPGAVIIAFTDRLAKSGVRMGPFQPPCTHVMPQV